MRNLSEQPEIGVREATKLENYILELRGRNERLQELLTRLDQTYITRLDNLCNRLNTIDFPKNSEAIEKDTVKADAELKRSVDGLSQDFNEVLEVSSNLLNKFENRIFNELSTSISYLEKHI